MGLRHKRGRPVNGVVLLDKSVGRTSNQALQMVKRLFDARKAGHTGSLDPLASGMLPICLGEATKISAFLLDADKVYRVKCRLGETSTTGDAEGERLTSVDVPTFSDREIENALAVFRGEIEQTPPMYSALHHQGRRLYELAREGVEVERQSRRICIKRLELLDRDELTLHLEVYCSKGTYIRSLVSDIGDALGCGAHVTALRRLGVEPYLGREMLTLAALEQRLAQGRDCLDEVIQGADSAVERWPSVRLDQEMADFVRHGQPVFVPQAPERGWVRLYQGEASFIGVGEIDDGGRVAPRRVFQY